ncbi:MAG: serine/threonine-protein kinase [Vicinamibacterales bacterium]
MSLSVGTRLGAYEVVSAIGAGGMGEVYRARDTTLNRVVAIKVLPDLFAADPERLARFTREAQTLASLNHPNIAQIYGVEGHALVMEFVDGDDLSHRIAQGAMPIEDALPIARQIADALEAAHEHGIVHRDLKPANIKVRADGTVKVLDFGLAKALQGSPEALRYETQAAAQGVNVANSPTFTAHGRLREGDGGPSTQLGMIIGTAAYMAPEQARGKAVDRRADIWAFGAVLYEMLTGKRAFEGDEISDVLASVLKSDPAWTAIPTDVPPSIRRLLRRCLEKDPRKRLSSICDARLDLDEQEPAPVPPTAAVPPPPVRRSLASYLRPALVGALLTAAAALLAWSASGPRASHPLRRVSLLPPPGETLYPDSTGVAISPDGTMVAFIVGTVARSETQLWVRSLDSMTARRLEDADGASLPFW